MRARSWAALAAGVLSLGHAAVGLADVNTDDPQSVSDYSAVLLFSAALIAAAVALMLLRSLGAGQPRSAWTFGLTMAVGGASLAGIGNAAEDAAGVSAFGLAFALGGLALVIGLLTAGGRALATASPRRWIGLALILIAVGTAVGEEAGFALVGLTWIGLAFVLARQQAVHPVLGSNGA